MIIEKIKKGIETSNHPILRSLHQGPGFKVLIMGFKKGMVLKEHKAHIRSKLTVLEGSVHYEETDRAIKLDQYHEVEIPVEINHSVRAEEDSLCLLTQG